MQTAQLPMKNIFWPSRMCIVEHTNSARVCVGDFAVRGGPFFFCF